ncbi:CubicO group peptidase (beta-lactamase class C family) [Epilithonimonas hungarica]|uniref:serine hydrolase n=1 Tax=Epilithonimonas hungarica TaxID=454006 RepID=UPI002788243C|nr:serine hydrolase [Epilithonimonas hungarica]MDP9957831.1 CubicO group peptidase (beta-lactamase class C family) [Epilithonimonas hungarica]
MKQAFLTLLFLNLSFLGFCQKAEKTKSIDNYLTEVMKTYEIPGLAVGVVKNDKIIFQKYYGRENLESDKKVDSHSLFRVYSTTKLITNVAVFQLIEKGQLSLEDKISKYVDNLPKQWQDVKIKNLLSHSSGIPDFARYEDIPADASNAQVFERLSKEKMEFETGNQFSYNQTNYMLLAMIIEKITRQKFEDYVQKNQFSDANNKVIFSSNSIEEVPNRIQLYRYNDSLKQYKKSTHVGGLRSHPGNGLAISLPDFLQWSINLDTNKFLTDNTKKIMWRSFDYTNKQDVFAHGWEITKTGNIMSYGFSGGNVSAYSIFPENDLSIIFMSNGYKYNAFPPLYFIANHIAGLIDKQLANPYWSREESIASEIINKPDVKKEIYGYKIENDNVIFTYKIPKDLNAEAIDKMSVAGSFNDWNPGNTAYQMVLKDKNTFELVLPKSQFEKGKTYEFRFVMNKSGWFTTPYSALNTNGNPNDNNLTFRVD